MKKRFIAGAVCPKCGAKDSVRVFLPEGDEPDEQTRDCVDCGYLESLQKPMAARQELPTRVSKKETTSEARDATKAQKLTIH